MFEQKLFLVSAELSGDETSSAVQLQKPRVWGKVACKNHEPNRGKWSDSLCKGWSQVHTVDQTVHPLNKHSFVSQRLLVGRWPCLCSRIGREQPFETGGDTHTHTMPIPALKRCSRHLTSLRKKGKDRERKRTGQERKLGVVTRPTSYETF